MFYMPCQLGDPRIQPIYPNYVSYKIKQLNLFVMAKARRRNTLLLEIKHIKASRFVQT